MYIFVRLQHNKNIHLKILIDTRGFILTFEKFIWYFEKKIFILLFQDMKPHVSKITALFLLSQVFLIITHVPLVRLLAWIIFAGDANIFTERGASRIAEYSSTTTRKKANNLTVRKTKIIQRATLFRQLLIIKRIVRFLPFWHKLKFVSDKIKSF